MPIAPRRRCGWPLQRCAPASWRLARTAVAGGLAARGGGRPGSSGLQEARCASRNYTVRKSAALRPRSLLPPCDGATDAMLCRMNTRVDHALEDVLRLSAEERSAVAAALIDSLETGEEGSVAEAWRTELLRRRADLRAGLVKAAPWSEVRARMSAM